MFFPTTLSENLRAFFRQEVDFFHDFLAELDLTSAPIRKMLGNLDFYKQIAVKPDCFQISKEKSGEWQLAVVALYLDGVKTTITPLRLSLSQGKRRFSLRHHLEQYAIKFLRTLALKKIVSECRNKISFSPPDDPELQKIRIEESGIISYNGRAIRYHDYRLATANIIRFHQARKIIFRQKGGAITVSGGDEGDKEDNEETIELRREGERLYLRRKTNQRGKIRGKDFLSGGKYDQGVEKRLIPKLPPILSGNISQILHPDLIRPALNRLRSFYPLLKEKPRLASELTDYAALFTIREFFRRQHAAANPRLPFPVSLSRMARVINESGGGAAFTAALRERGILFFNFVDNLAKSRAAAARFISLWHFVQNQPGIFHKFNPRRESTWILIGMYSSLPQAEKILQTLADHKGLPVDLIKDKALILNIGRILKNEPTLTTKTALAKAIVEAEKARSFDPLSLKKDQKINLLTLTDTADNDPAGSFYLEQSLAHNYRPKALGQKTHLQLTGGAEKDPLESFRHLIHDQIRQSAAKNNKLFILISAHGSADSDQTSLGNILELLITGLKKLPAATRGDFIARNLIIGTSQCYGGSLLKRFQEELGVKPLLSFSESGADSINTGYFNHRDKISIHSKFLLTYYAKTREFASKGHYTTGDGRKITARPTIPRILNEINRQEINFAVQMSLNDSTH